MELLTFKKGVHPPHGKHLTEKKPIEEYLPKGDLVFPLSQHIGAPCTALVKKGDRVLVGQKIGEAGGFVSAPIYSSVSGTVKNVEPRMTSMGTKAMSIIVENDNLYEAVEKAQERDYEKLSNEEIVSIIKEAGIVGMGGATFPTHVKLTPPKDKTIDSIIINAAECEPYLTCDHRLMLEEGEKIVEGLKIILKLFPQAKGYIGIENNKPDAIAAMNKLTANESRIEVKALKTKYPQGAEKQLIYAVTKREVPSGKLPADVSCIVQNVGTAYQIYKSVVQGEPLIERIVTVTGEAIKEPKNLKVKLGTSVQELIEEACGGFKEDPVKVISGGPMMGMTISTIEIPVTKGTSGILALTKDMAVLPDTSNCIRCGKCVEACPMNLLPTKLQSLSQRNELEEFENFHGLDCIECGCCTFVCPAKKNILQSIRVAKRAVLANKRKK